MGAPGSDSVQPWSIRHSVRRYPVTAISGQRPIQRRSASAGSAGPARARLNNVQARDLLLSPQLDTAEAARFLASLNFQRPAEADAALQRMAERIGARDRFADSLPALLHHVSSTPDPDFALLQWDAFLEASPSPLTVITFVEGHPAAMEVLSRLLGSSPYLTQLLLRNPEYFYWLLEQDRLHQVPEDRYFLAECEQVTRPFEGEPGPAVEALRRLRRRETLRIAAQDLLGIATLEQVVRQVSDCADAVLESAYRVLSAQLLGSPAPFAVLGLGKLGGRELNFSSDVDLIYVYADGTDPGSMVRFGREYTRLLTQYSGQGHLYRVDLRLRPMGKTGEIAYPLSASLHYYQTWADTFDRLALMKCRVVAGDSQVGQHFVDSIQQLIFRKYPDVAAVEEIRWIKRRTDKKLREREEVFRNVKLGYGGIREIEFFVQAFQLLYGGLHPEIRTPNTLLALDRLVDQGFILPKDYRVLKTGYVYLRELEHRLQLVNDLQTHTLPRNDAELERCARRLGYRGKPGDPERHSPLAWFAAELEHRTSAVHEVFESLFEEVRPGQGLEEIALSSDMDQAEAVDRLRSAGCKQPGDLYEAFRELAESPAFPHSPSRVRNLLANLLPRLVEYCALTSDPRALISRFDRLCEAVGSRGSMYAEVVENQEFARRLFKVLAAGDFVSETLIRSPELLDYIARWHPGDRGEDRAALDSASDPDPKVALRRFKRREEFKIAVDDILGVETFENRKRLSELADNCLAAAVREVLARLPELASEDCLFLALGKLGGQELTYHSDLDLLFVFDDRPGRIPPVRFNDFVRECREQLEGYTEEGSAYKLDLRLRPEGKHGPLAAPFTAFEQYFRERAESWERLAYMKARVAWTSGWTPEFGQLFFGQEDKRGWLDQLRHVRERKEDEIGRETKSSDYDFKVGLGGLLDVQFAVQFLQLMHQLKEPNTRRAIGKLKDVSLLTDRQATVLTEGLRFLFHLEANRRLLEQASTTTIPKAPGENEVLSRFAGYASGEEFIRGYLEQRARIREVYEEIMRV